MSIHSTTPLKYLVNIEDFHLVNPELEGVAEVREELLSGEGLPVPTDIHGRREMPSSEFLNPTHALGGNVSNEIILRYVYLMQRQLTDAELAAIIRQMTSIRMLTPLIIYGPESANL